MRPRQGKAEKVRYRGRDEDKRNMPRGMPPAELAPRRLHYISH